MTCKHPAYGQHLLKLGFPANDPLVELAVVWVNGGCASASLVRQARLSAESWAGNRDKFRARACRSIVNKLLSYEAESFARPSSARGRDASGSEAARRRAAYDESRSTSESAHKQISAAAACARAEYLRNRFAAQEVAQLRRELDTIDGRRNPYREDRYYADRLIKKGTKRRSKRKATKRGMLAVLGRMNPRKYGRPNENDIPTVVIKRKRAGRRNPRARPNENDIPTVKIVRKRNPNARKRKVAARRYFQHKYDMGKKVSHATTKVKRRSSFERITAATRAYAPLSLLGGEFVKRGKDKHLIAAYGNYLESRGLPKRGKYRRNPPITKRQAATIKAVLRRHGY